MCKSLIHWATLALASLACLTACSPVAAEETQVPYQAPQLQGDPARVVWWFHVTELGSSLLWLGPTVLSADGREQRFWTMSCTMPGASQPCIWFQSAVDLSSTEPLAMKAADYAVSLTPLDGLTWGQVYAPDQIRGAIEGFAP